MKFSELNILVELKRAIADQGYEEVTPVQKLTIPIIQSRVDLLAGAQTGTGKTAAFALPLLERVHNSYLKTNKRGIRAVIITPTRELCKQVNESIVNYGAYLPSRSMTLFGGVSITPQLEKLERGVDIIVATPGRLQEFIDKKYLSLSKVEVLVLDEADRMLDMGFMKDIDKIIEATPKKRQTLLFSATFTKSVKTLAKKILKSPKMLETTRSNATAESVKQIIHPVDLERKNELLSYLIGSKNYTQVLVFTRTKESAENLISHLELDGLKSASIHGDKTQAARLKALNAFKEGKIRVLVATDVVSRGIDIKELPQVINYELPDIAEDYVHRIGRTGRAGHEGLAISLISEDERKKVNSVEHLIQQKIEVVMIDGFEPTKKSKDKNSGIAMSGRNKKSDKVKVEVKQKPKRVKITKRSRYIK